MSILLVLVLLAAACSGESDAANVTTAPSSSTTAATTTSVSTDSSDTTTTTTTADPTTTTTSGPVVTAIDISLANGVVDRVERFDVPLDGVVRLTVTADVSDEIHLHGYDLHADVTPDTKGVLEFSATIPGVFEIELEDSGVLIGELQVAP